MLERVTDKSEIMMRGLHPSNAGELPMTRNMPFSTKTMPSKSHNRNMTGIYLGLVSINQNHVRLIKNLHSTTIFNVHTEAISFVPSL